MPMAKNQETFNEHSKQEKFEINTLQNFELIVT